MHRVEMDYCDDPAAKISVVTKPMKSNARAAIPSIRLSGEISAPKGSAGATLPQPGTGESVSKALRNCSTDPGRSSGCMEIAQVIALSVLADNSGLSIRSGVKALGSRKRA